GLQYAGIKVQVKHFDQLFRIYIKSIGKDTVCRVEESINPKKPAIQVISGLFTSHTEYMEGQQSSLLFSHDDSKRKITEIHEMVKSLLNLQKTNSAINIEPHELSKGDDVPHSNSVKIGEPKPSTDDDSLRTRIDKIMKDGKEHRIEN